MQDFENSNFKTVYTGPERRNDHLTADRVALMIEEALAEALNKHESRMIMHIDVKFGQMHKFIADAFPNGDPHGHRMFHEKSIRDADAWAKIRGEVLAKFLSGGLWVAAGWLVFAIWQAFKEGVKS